MNLRVSEVRKIDVGRGIVRIDPDVFTQLGARFGDVLAIEGKRTTVAKALPLPKDVRGQSLIQMDGTTRANAQVSLDDMVAVARIELSFANTVALRVLDGGEALRPHAIQQALEGIPVCVGDRVRVNRLGAEPQHYEVVKLAPDDAALLDAQTHITIVAGDDAPKQKESAQRGYVSYEDIGGLDREIQRIREMVELPMRYPQVFRHLGITPPKGVLLYGPPGSGKTLIARALAYETNTHFIVVNGPEIIDKFYGQSESALRGIFEEAQRHTPSIVFIDEIDAIAPKRDRVEGEVEKRVVAQLLTLLDGLEDRGDIVVIAATNLPDRIDPALRRPGRFDREIAIPMPNQQGREMILAVHTRGMPLAADVDMERIAAGTHGFVGADLQALCREAAMNALRRFLAASSEERLTLDDLFNITVCNSDWEAARMDVVPTVTREVFAETPDVTWDAIGGLSNAKKALQQAIQWPLRYPEVFAEARLNPPAGILLAGPPGSGKTLLAKALANEAGVNFIGVKGPELVSKWVGESESAVREVFRVARLAAPCVLFFDEFDALARTRTGGDPVLERVVAQLLTELDGMEDRRGVTVLASTNRPDLIDPALRRPGRFDMHFTIELPDERARAEILDIHLRGRPVADVDVSAMATATEGWSGAELADWVRRAAMRAVERTIETGSALVFVEADFSATFESDEEQG